MEWDQEKWAVGTVVLTLAVLMQTRVTSTNRSDAQMCVGQISLPPWSWAEKYLTEPANELAVRGVQPPGRAACPVSTGSGSEKSLLSFSFKLCSLALGLSLAGGVGRAVPWELQRSEEKGESLCRIIRSSSSSSHVGSSDAAPLSQPSSR